jgi:superfamily I DNA/RNA helicase/mRNA-degrading endonuclease RelE of RelBE toxin-antitoxin system
MEFRIADTFTDSLAKLTGDEQKAVKTTAFDLQLDPANPGMQFHKLNKAKDKNFWSIRVSRDIRVIVHRSESSLLLCYVDHHDPAYAWAERRKLERHPKTGAAQLVEVRETVREIEVPRYVEVEAPEPEPQPVAPAAPQPPIFADVPEDDLLSYGVPPEWLADVRQATEDSILELADHLPAEAAEALLELATGSTPAMPVQASPEADPFAHPDAQRRFRVMTNAEELEQALDFPWEKWTIFLHPAQREQVERSYSGPARVSGSAGTGKTIVALHRAAHLARAHPEARVLLTTFSETLANALRARLKRLLASEPRLAERLEVHAMSAIGLRLYEANFGRASLATRADIEPLLAEARQEVEADRFTPHFLWTEWANVVDAWQLTTWEAYRDVRRLGRKTRLAETHREVLWSIFERVRAGLAERELTTEASVFGRLAEQVAGAKQPAFDFVVVDEAQDIGVAELRFLAALGGGRADSLFFAGDLGQRIFQQPFSWKALGVDIRGRSRTLRINYRTSHQIRMQADKLLGPEISDVDGNTEDRRGTVSVFNGTSPAIQTFDGEEEEQEAVGSWIAQQLEAGLEPQEIAVFVRSDEQLARAQAAVDSSGTKSVVLDKRMETRSGHIALATMHHAKGLEFRAVSVMACDDEVIPLQERIETVTDDSDLEDVYQTERHLLYVACTRARDHLLITGMEPASEFIDDIIG